MDESLKFFSRLHNYGILAVIFICFAVAAFFLRPATIPVGAQLNSFESCLADTKVDIRYPLDNTWWYDSQSVFVPTLRHPIAIAYAESASQVQELVKCATKHKVKINPRSGGHSYEAFCNEDNHFVIDISRINFVNINDIMSAATVGAGVRLGRLYYKLGIHQMTFPAGDCPTVGLGGHVGAGGFGLLGRLWGLSVDNVLELEMVDWNGEVLVANAETNEDLYFALRGGGGGSYGIVTSMKLRIYKNPPLSTAFIIRFNKQIPASDFSKAWFKWKPWENMPREMTIVMSLAKASFMFGIYVGEGGHLGLERILNESGYLELGPEGSQSYQYYESPDLLRARAWAYSTYLGYVYLGNNMDYFIYNTASSAIFNSLNLPPYPTPVHPTWATIQNDTRVNAAHHIFSAGSMGVILYLPILKIDRDYKKYTTQIFDKDFDEAAYKALDEFISHDGVVRFFPFGGIINSVPEDFNAFPHRGQFFFAEFVSPYNPTGTDTALALAEQKAMSAKILRAMEPYTNHRSYQGCLDLFWTTQPKKYMPRYFGDNVQRLIRAKIKYDPRNVFSNEQSTPLVL